MASGKDTLGVFTTVLDVRPSHAEGTVRHGVDAPGPGWRLEGATLKCVGWVATDGSPVTAVELVHRGTVLRHEPVAIPRPDVAGEKQAFGYWFLAGLLGLPTDVTVEIRAVTADGRHVPLAVYHLEREPLRGAVEPRIAPLFVTSLGRMGTTWLLRLLSRHPSVLAFDHYPYEVRPAAYWLHALRVLNEPADHARSSHPDDFPFDLQGIGHNPFNTGLVREVPSMDRWFSDGQLAEHVRFVQASIDGFYGALAESSGLPSARYFVEKAPPGHIGQLACELYATGRELVLVRDPRDVLTSVRAFDRKRGVGGFGTDRYASVREFVVHLRDQMAALLADWNTRQGRALLVRYEDLVTDPHRRLDDILGHLELDQDEQGRRRVMDAVDDDDDSLAAHRTTPSAAASIGRWQRDLEPELGAMATEILQPVLEPFGYG